jgi:hypothetical protein
MKQQNEGGCFRNRRNRRASERTPSALFITEQCLLTDPF